MAKVKEEDVVAVIGDICSDFARGKTPYELIARFRKNPWPLLEPLEVLETRFGELIPKDVDETSVRVARNPDNGSSVTIGVRRNGTFWSSASRVPNIPLDMKRANGPFFPSVGRPRYIIAANGSVGTLAGSRVSDKVLSENPLIVYSSHDRKIVKYEDETLKWREYWPEKFFGEPVGAVLTNGTLAVWDENGRVNVAEGGPSVLGCNFPFVPGQTIESVAKWSEFVAIVFRFAGERPYSRLVVLQHGGRIRTQTIETYGSISAPVFRQDGTLFVRIDGMLMRMSPTRSSLEEVRSVSGNPWITENDVVVITNTTETVLVFKDNHFTVTAHREPAFVQGRLIGLPSSATRMDVIKVSDDGELITITSDPALKWEDCKCVETENGYALTCIVSRHSLADKRRTLYVGARVSSRSELYDDRLCIDTEHSALVFDHHQVVTKGTRVYAVVRFNDEAKSWRVVMGGHRSKMSLISNRGSSAIFCLHIDGPLLCWYQYDFKDREITLCRMYIGE